jgi:hypothetical protein
MTDFLLLMHSDVVDDKLAADATLWAAYLNTLRASGQFDGGSSIGTGQCFRKVGSAASRTDALSGYIRVRAADIDEARRYLDGNPVFEAGGTVEIRELPRD